MTDSPIRLEILRLECGRTMCRHSTAISQSCSAGVCSIFWCLVLKESVSLVIHHR